MTSIPLTDHERSTWRDELSARAMQTLLAANSGRDAYPTDMTVEAIARVSYELADMMLRIRDESPSDSSDSEGE